MKITSTTVEIRPAVPAVIEARTTLELTPDELKIVWAALGESTIDGAKELMGRHSMGMDDKIVGRLQSKLYLDLCGINGNKL